MNHQHRINMSKDKFVNEKIIDFFCSEGEHFLENGKPKHMNEKYFIKFHYDFINARERSKREKKECIFPGCNNTCVMSHTIPEAAALKKISRDGFVLFPKFNSKTNHYEMERISTRQASVFPGFCPDHENLFKDFEENGDFKHPSIALQNFRIVCKYYFIWRSLRETFEEILSKYRTETTEYHKNTLKAITENVKTDFKIISVSDEVVDHLEKTLVEINSNIDEIYNNDYAPYHKSIINDDDEVQVIIFSLPAKLPIALAGKSCFELEGDGGKVKFTVHFSILPSDKYTALCFSLNKEYAPHFLLTLQNYKSLPSFLGFIESWMIYGTDYWYISPEEWNNYSEKKQKSILRDLKLTCFYPNARLPYTIFDKVRNELKKQSRKSTNNNA